MKKSSALNFLAFTLILLWAGSSFAAESKESAIRGLLERSTYEHKLVPAGWPKTYKYDPVALSVIASLYSRLPARNERDWSSVRLPLAAESSRYYSGDMEGHFRKGNSPFAPFFVVFPGSYATWKRGSYVNQTVAELDKAFGRPHILVFAGILSPEFLTGHLNRMPWNVSAIGKDLFSRIMRFKRQTLPHAEGGVIGYSGGASIALELLAQNSETGEDIFSLGGMAFSPVLHQRLAFENLDGRGARSNIRRTHALTTLDPWNIWTMAKSFGSASWTDLLDMSPSRTTDFQDRFFNEFSAVDLRETMKAVGLPAAGVGEPPHHGAAYIQRGFLSDLKPREARPRNANELNEMFDRKTDSRITLGKITEPLLLYFSADDPVLSTPYPGSAQPQALNRILQYAQSRQNITVFNPRHGGHVGALVDEIFPQLLKTFFER